MTFLGWNWRTSRTLLAWPSLVPSSSTSPNNLKANLWLLAEARWHAEWSRNAWAQFADLLDLDDDVGTKATVAKPLPWEIAGKVADANG